MTTTKNDNDLRQQVDVELSGRKTVPFGVQFMTTTCASRWTWNCLFRPLRDESVVLDDNDLRQQVDVELACRRRRAGKRMGHWAYSFFSHHDNDLRQQVDVELFRSRLEARWAVFMTTTCASRWTWNVVPSWNHNRQHLARQRPSGAGRR